MEAARVIVVYGKIGCTGNPSFGESYGYSRLRSPRLLIYAIVALVVTTENSLSDALHLDVCNERLRGRIASASSTPSCYETLRKRTSLGIMKFPFATATTARLVLDTQLHGPAYDDAHSRPCNMSNGRL